MTDPALSPADVREQRRPGPPRVGDAVVGAPRAAPAGPRRPAGRRQRAARGPARHRQDAGGPLLRAGARAGLPARAVHPGPAARRRDRRVDVRPGAGGVRVPARVRCSPSCCSPTRSTAPRRGPRRRCSRRCRSGRSPSRARRTRCEPPFHVLATANPIEFEGTYPLPEAQLDRFLLRISFGHLAAGRRSGTCCSAGSRGGSEEQTLGAGHRRRRAAGDGGRGRAGARWRRASGGTRSTWSRRAAATRRCSPAPRPAARWR